MPRITLVNGLRAIWVVVILWYELATFSYQVSKCPWPRVPAADPHTAPTHVLLIADPQVLDHRSYPDRPAWLMWLSQWIVDFNMRKSWWVTKQLRPDAVVFLGDMMDGGRFAMSDEEYGSYLRRAKSIFATDPSVPELFLPGNHDVGIGVSDDWSDRARDRWITNFGPLQQMVEIANHTVVLLDAPGIVEDEQQRKVSGLSLDYWSNHHPNGPIAFAKRAADIALSRNQPTVLFTHIPLFRPRGTPCGPLRERGTIRDGSGYGYENTLDSVTSAWIINGIRPSVVFSGDDHDYCEVYHTIPPSENDAAHSKETSVKEISVKSFSIAMGIHRPGFQLLSLYPPSSLPSPSSPTFADAPCFLPNQLNTYLFVYGPLIGLSILLLLLSHLRHTYLSPSPSHTYTSSRRTLTLTPTQTTSALPPSILPLTNPPTTLHALRNYDDTPDDTGEADYMLPPPTPAAHVTAKSRRRGYPSYVVGSLVWKFSVGGRKVVADLSGVREVLGGGCCGGGGGRRGRRRSGVRGFVGDVLQVGWVAVGVFLVVAWWFS